MCVGHTEGFAPLHQDFGHEGSGQGGEGQGQDAHSGQARGSVTQVRVTAGLRYVVHCVVGAGREIGCGRLVAFIHFQAAFHLDVHKLNCVSDAAETILPGIAVDFGGVAQVPEAQVTIVALQSLAN